MKLIENYIFLGNGNILSNGRLLTGYERHYLVADTTNLELLEFLFKKEYHWARYSIAKNHLITTDMIEILSKDEDWYVRQSVAMNSTTPLNILEVLSHDESWIVRCGVTKNPLAPIDMLKNLSQDKDKHVRKDAKRILKNRKS